MDVPSTIITPEGRGLIDASLEDLVQRIASDEGDTPANKFYFVMERLNLLGNRINLAQSQASGMSNSIMPCASVTWSDDISLVEIDDIRAKFEARLKYEPIGRKQPDWEFQLHFDDDEIRKLSNFIFHDILGPAGIARASAVACAYRNDASTEMPGCRAHDLSQDKTIPTGLREFFGTYSRFISEQRFPINPTSQVLRFFYRYKLVIQHQSLVNKPQITLYLSQNGHVKTARQSWPKVMRGYLAQSLGDSHIQLRDILKESRPIRSLADHFHPGIFVFLPSDCGNFLKRTGMQKATHAVRLAKNVLADAGRAGDVVTQLCKTAYDNILEPFLNNQPRPHLVLEYEENLTDFTTALMVHNAAVDEAENDETRTTERRDQEPRGLKDKLRDELIEEQAWW